MPIEFRELKHPDKEQTQGIIEMWVEILTIEESRYIPMAKLNQNTNKEDFEVRLILWETREVPLVDGDSVDIYLKAIFFADSWDSENETKQTDVHYKSTDGRGRFNYRMKFLL